MVREKFNPAGQPVTPYQKAAKEWDDRIGSARVQAHNWRLAALLVILCVALPSIAGLVYVSAQPKPVHIIEVSADGSAQYRGVGGRAYNNYKPSDASVKYHLRRFVNNTRMITSDQAVLKGNWLDAYNFVTQNARNTLNGYVQNSNPFERAITERIGVAITAMVQVSADTWQVDWIESKWNDKGLSLGDDHWRGMFKVVLQQPADEEQLAVNPIGLYIDELHWSKIQQQ